MNGTEDKNMNEFVFEDVFGDGSMHFIATDEQMKELTRRIKKKLPNVDDIEVVSWTGQIVHNSDGIKEREYWITTYARNDGFMIEIPRPFTYIFNSGEYIATEFETVVYTMTCTDADKTYDYLTDKIVGKCCDALAIEVFKIVSEDAKRSLDKY